ncbi:MAG: hypothetical protein V1495_07305 [Pseudomonadota bacterium]
MKKQIGWDKGFEGVRQRQAVLGLSLTPAERLEWLFQMIQLFRKVKRPAKTA